jgi:hypothetical protein
MSESTLVASSLRNRLCSTGFGDVALPKKLTATRFRGGCKFATTAVPLQVEVNVTQSPARPPRRSFAIKVR